MQAHIRAIRGRKNTHGKGYLFLSTVVADYSYCYWEKPVSSVNQDMRSPFYCTLCKNELLCHTMFYFLYYCIYMKYTLAS